MSERFTAYMVGVDFQSERGQPREGSPLYATPDAVLRHRTAEGGVVEVEVKLIRWVQEQTLPTQPVEDVRRKDAHRGALEEELNALIDELWEEPEEVAVAILADWVAERRQERLAR